MTFALLAMGALALFVPAASSARTVYVTEGQSIQDAIDQAKPWTTIKIGPGTYSESLLINKDGIRLIGDSRKNTKIAEPASPTAGRGCVPPEAGEPPNGICIFDVNENFEPQSTVNDVEIRNLSLQGFGIGVFAVHTRDVTVAHTIESNYSEYGIFSNDSTGSRIVRNVTYNSNAAVNPEAGIYVGDSPNAYASVKKNVSWGNSFGVFVRDAAHGWINRNRAFSNCVGILWLNTDAPVQPSDWHAEDNRVFSNNRQCPPGEEGGPPISGVGMGVYGAADIDIVGNDVFGNASAPDFPSAFTGGIVVVTASDLQPPVPSTGIRIAFNTAYGNATDIAVDEGNEARAYRNDCETSRPDGLCDDTDYGDDDDEQGRDHDGGGRNDSGKGGNHRKHERHSSHKHRSSRND